MEKLINKNLIKIEKFALEIKFLLFIAIYMFCSKKIHMNIRFFVINFLISKILFLLPPFNKQLISVYFEEKKQKDHSSKILFFG